MAAAEFCGLCEVETAAWRCETCTFALCDACREATHSADDADTAGHALTLLGDGSEMMAQMERRAEAEASRATRAAADAAALPAGTAVVLAEAAGLWLNAAGEIAGRIELLAPVDDGEGAARASGERAVAMLRFVPADALPDDGRDGGAIASWGAAASPLQQDGGAPVLLLDSAQRFSFELASVVYFCVEEVKHTSSLPLPVICRSF